MTDFGQAFGWKSYICRCGNMVPHNLSTKYCPGSYVEGPLWSDYLSTHHEHVHWAASKSPASAKMPKDWAP